MSTLSLYAQPLVGSRQKLIEVNPHTPRRAVVRTSSGWQSAPGSRAHGVNRTAERLNATTYSTISPRTRARGALVHARFGRMRAAGPTHHSARAAIQATIRIAHSPIRMMMSEHGPENFSLWAWVGAGGTRDRWIIAID